MLPFYHSDMEPAALIPALMEPPFHASRVLQVFRSPPLVITKLEQLVSNVFFLLFSSG